MRPFMESDPKIWSIEEVNKTLQDLAIAMGYEATVLATRNSHRSCEECPAGCRGSRVTILFGLSFDDKGEINNSARLASVEETDLTKLFDKVLGKTMVGTKQMLDEANARRAAIVDVRSMLDIKKYP